MANIHELVRAWGDINSAMMLDRIRSLFPDGEAEKYDMRMSRMLPQLISLLDSEIRITVNSVSAKVPPPAPELKEWKDADFDTTAPFEELFSAYGRNMADSLRVWFKDIEGGYDASSLEDRKAVYGKARNYFVAKPATPSQPPSAPRTNVVTMPVVKKTNRRSGPCPDCGNDRIITTKYGQRYRCQDHEWWGDVG